MKRQRHPVEEARRAERAMELDRAERSRETAQQDLRALAADALRERDATAAKLAEVETQLQHEREHSKMLSESNARHCATIERIERFTAKVRGEYTTAIRERDEEREHHARLSADYHATAKRTCESLAAQVATLTTESERLRGEVERLKTNAPETTSDGYHTFAELYDHRITLFIAWAEEVDARTPTGFVWRSKLHSDGSKFDGWFVMGVGTRPGEQITYHLPLSRWEETDWLGTESERAPEFDGHTSADVLARIRRYYERDTPPASVGEGKQMDTEEP